MQGDTLPADAWAAARFPEIVPLPFDPAASLAASAETFDRLGLAFDAEFTRQMLVDARSYPVLYRDWARQQAARAERKAAERGRPDAALRKLGACR